MIPVFFAHFSSPVSAGCGGFQPGWWGLGPAMTPPRTHQPYHSGETLLMSLTTTILKGPEVLLIDMDDAYRPLHPQHRPHFCCLPLRGDVDHGL
ncbi:hypothetical protein EDD15DRAFT_1634370 [Pisolithus albus]|nr:hypothetical protein EDD15DRAFT_1634370 [Pisolithus albus]